MSNDHWKPPPLTLTVRQICERYQIPESTFWARFRHARGFPEAIKIGERAIRFYKDEVDIYFMKHRGKANVPALRYPMKPNVIIRSASAKRVHEPLEMAKGYILAGRMAGLETPEDDARRAILAALRNDNY